MSGPQPRISLIVARAQNGVIGRDNRMPWHLPADLKHFKALTLGQAVIMGRKTWDSILATLGRPLPGRTSFVLTRNQVFAAPGAISVNAPRVALDNALQASPKGIWVIGGAEIYRAMLPFATDAHVTEIKENFNGDAFFPALDLHLWGVVERTAGRDNDLDYEFIHYQRKLAQ